MTYSKKIFSFVILLCLLISLSGCKNDSNPSSTGSELVGTWVLTKLTTTTPQGTQEMTPDQANFHMTLIIRSDGTYTSNLVDQTGPSVDNGTWAIVTGKINVKHQDGSTETAAYTVAGSKLTLNSTTKGPNGESTPIIMEFTKQ